jgi:hypothetical protein
MKPTMLTDDDKQWMLAQSERNREWMRVQLERVETKLPTEFQERASPRELRARTHAAVLRALELDGTA